MEKILFYEDFSCFPVGKIQSNYFATEEYHYFPSNSYRGAWYESRVSYKWRPCDAAWQIIEDNGVKKLLSTLDSSYPYERILVTGDALWQNYKVSLKFSFLNETGVSGIVFRYQNNREFYSLLIKDCKTVLLKKTFHTREEILYQVDLAKKENFLLEAEVNGSNICARINDNFEFNVFDETYPQGRVGIICNTTILFENFKVTTNEKEFEFYLNRVDREKKELENIREEYPKPELYKKIDTTGFGTGRQIRFGHLRNKDRLDILLAQNLKLQPEKDEYSTIRALTAIDLDGNILWQIGSPFNSIESGIATCDLPVQIYDIDNDGNDEVIFAKNFCLYIADGSTGSIKKSVKLPKNIEDENRFGYLIPDAIIIANFRGRKHASDIIIKNRYHQIWVFDENLNLLWSAKRPKGLNPANTGHFPVAYDVNNDGHDELFIGYTLLDCEGKVLWNHDLPDHTDEIIIGNFNPDYNGLQIAAASGDEGFIIFDALTGKIVYKELLGHAQRIAAAKFRDDLPGLQFYLVTYWHYSGIISFHDCTGKRLFSFEPTNLGNILNPVNWRGDGLELALLNTNCKNGGLIDGYGRVVVTFPDDGHPTLSCEAIDIAGDSRSEIVTWDMNSIWIYTQGEEFKGSSIYNPIRASHYNSSNYRGEYSFPRWKKV